jgi:hypothetical protein
MEILKLTLEKKWFDMILSGEKKTEYRALKTYWVQRFYNYKNLTQTPKEFLALLESKTISPTDHLKNFTHIQFFNGGHFSEELPNFIIPLYSLYIGKGFEAWGAEPDVNYFALCLGTATTKNNIKS